MRLLMWVAMMMPAIAGAGEITMLGIELGSPFSAPACQVLPGSRYEVMQSAVTAPCLDPVDADHWRNLAGKVWIPPRDLPHQIKNPVMAYFANGVPWSIKMEFAGLNGNAGVVAFMEKALGVPSESRDVLKQNAFGATFMVTEADWKTDAYKANIRVVAIDSGYASVSLRLPLRQRAGQP